MSPVSHQTVKLAKGKHTSPDEGACVLELASMLAGEPFSDHPASACPVLGSFLRAYNDSIGDERRQDLYPYAARVVGTRASVVVQRQRAELLADWAEGMRRRRSARFLPRWLGGLRPHRPPPAHGIGMYAVRAIRRHTDETHRKALALVDELLEIGAPSDAPTAPDATCELPPALYPIA
jgi:hypothetical protein